MVLDSDFVFGATRGQRGPAKHTTEVGRGSAWIGLLVWICCAGCGHELQPLMGMALPGLSGEERELFEAGRQAFSKQLVEAEGLGPLFNDFGCGDCHNRPVPGGFSHRVNTRFGKAGETFDPLQRLGGSLLQFQSTVPSCEEFVPPEADVQSNRGTPHVFGLGLVEAIPDLDLLALQQEGPGVRGFAHWVEPLEGGPERVGRFGWKSQIATILSFSADAALDEMGFTNRLLEHENAPNGDQSKLPLGDFIADPEDRADAEGFALIDRVTHFQRFLAPPPQTPKSGMMGERVFEKIGCAVCHVSSFTTPESTSAALSHVTFKPYSNFLLHDMGSLSDGIAQGRATAKMMRTAPLWGLSARDAMNHDFKATGGDFAANVRKAILRHDGEAKASRMEFTALSPVEVERLIDFLESLGRAEFDWDRDHDVDWDDWSIFSKALLEKREAITADDDEAVFDVDRDGDLDWVDIGAFFTALRRDH